LCLGRGGTQHLFYKRFFSHGIQGAGALHAVGFAWALKKRGEQGMAIAQIGDGTLGEGALYEAFTFASLLKVPVLFLLEYNGYAQSTETSRTTPGNLIARAQGFGLGAHRISDLDLDALVTHMGSVTDAVRRNTPFLQIVDTRRLLAHSKGDDDRPAAIREAQWDQDPLNALLTKDARYKSLYESIQAELEEKAAQVVRRAPLRRDTAFAALPPSRTPLNAVPLEPQAGTKKTIVELLNAGLREIMQADPRVMVVGEDIQDPYGGAFKVTKGLSTAFPDRVFSTPIAEAAVVGVSNGLAVAGCRPGVEMMFADFVTLATDQLVNSSAKFYYMFGDQVRCPLVCRLVSGGGRGYGPTHSQSPERLLCGVPGLRVVALSRRHRPDALLKSVIVDDDAPTVFVEHKSLYPQTPLAEAPTGFEAFVPAGQLSEAYSALCYRPAGQQRADVTVVTYGGLTNLVEDAMKTLIYERELAFDYFVVTQLWPLNVEAIVRSVERTRRLVVVEEHAPAFGFSAAVISAVSQGADEAFRARAVGSKPVPLPSVRFLEDAVLPSKGDLMEAVSSLMKGGS
jgi:2-oxoisovalerate dehydrogenase E1 component